jgi:uncharacterized protein (TIGR00730 family)
MTAIQTLTVYLGSSGHARAVFQDAAAALGAQIGKAGMHLVYGGMDAGLMGGLARAALDAGADVTGIIPQKLKDSERVLVGLSQAIFVQDLWERKKRMFLKADAIISLPGGFGTMDESLEVLHWARLGLHDKPLVLVNIEGYWDRIISFLQTLPDFDARFLITVPDVESIAPALQNWAGVPKIEEDPEHLPHFEDEITRGTAEPIVIDRASVENTYFALCALGLKQLGRHTRPIGFLNTRGQFDDLLAWLETAAAEKFITAQCLKLYAVSDNTDDLLEKLRHQKTVSIDLHRDKWGERRKTER